MPLSSGLGITAKGLRRLLRVLWLHNPHYPKYVIRAYGKVPATSEQIVAGQLEDVAGYVESWPTARCRWEWADCLGEQKKDTKDHDAS